MKKGIEIEFRHPDRRTILANGLEIGIVNDTAHWNLGTDASLTPPTFNCLKKINKFLEKAMQNMFELRSPIFETLNDRLEQILKTIKDTGGDCSGCCGLHIHISDPRITKLDIDKFRASIVAKYSRSIREERKQYCDNTTHFKYNPVRQISDDHIEVRVFNSSFNPVYIRQKIKECTEMLEKHLDN